MFLGLEVKAVTGGSEFWHIISIIIESGMILLVIQAARITIYQIAELESPARGSSQKMPAHKVGGGGRAFEVLNPSFGLW